MTNQADNNKDDDNLGSFYMGRMRPPPEPDRVMPRGVLTAVAIVAFAAILWYAYPQGAEKYTDVDVPVITADTTTYKAQPENPGGMEIRHQDSTVFDSIDNPEGKKTESLLPGAEEPMDKTALGLGTDGPQLNLDPQLEETARLEAAKAAETAKTETIATQPATAPVTATETPATPKEEAAVTTPATTTTTEKPVAAIEPSSGGKDGGVYIQLGSYRAKAGAEKDWGMLQKKHPTLLGDLFMRTEQVDLGKKGVFHRLQAGTVTEARAKEICADLKQKTSGGCMVVR